MNLDMHAVGQVGFMSKKMLIIRRRDHMHVMFRVRHHVQAIAVKMQPQHELIGKTHG